MLRLVVCCGGGMSSSVLAVKFQEEIDAKGWQDKVSIDYLPLVFLLKQQEKYDIALLCPHLRYHAKQAIEAGIVKIPLYIIPARLYGAMRLQPLVEDGMDALKLYQENHVNPVLFPGESGLETRRNCSYRQWIKTHPVKTSES